MLKACQGIWIIPRESFYSPKVDRTGSSYFEIFSEIELRDSRNFSPEMVKMPEHQTELVKMS